jgi:hypothetical protein
MKQLLLKLGSSTIPPMRGEIWMKTALLLTAALGLLAAGASRAQTVDVSPQGLTRFAWCLEQARSDDAVYPGERGVGYRCVNTTAAGYFNELGRRGRDRRETVMHNENGAYVLRPISGLGNCWHQVEDQLGRPVSAWGCDVFIAY